MVVIIRTDAKLSKQARTALVLDICDWLRQLEAYEQEQSTIEISFYEGNDETAYASDTVNAEK
jgi:hypothetical protein